MSNWYNARCPKCGDTDHIDVCANVWVRLTGDGSAADESQDGSHEYDGKSACVCAACGYNGTLAKFEKRRGLQPRRRKRLSATRSNERRAEHAAAICDQYGLLTHRRPDYDAPEDIAADLITDLMHLIKAHDGDPLGKLQTATINYEAEQAGEE